MKQFFKYLKSRPLAFASFCVIAFLYLVMIFAPFIAPYSPNTQFDEETYHPSNIEFSLDGLKVCEYRALNPVTWEYAKVKDLSHKINFFVKGEQYKLFGLFDCETHLFGAVSDDGKKAYPVFIFGADDLGRDLFSRIVYGSRISLTVGIIASLISLFLAIVFGGISGFYGGKTDWTIMRLCEFFMLVPGLYLILFLRSLLNSKMDSGTSYIIITIILSLIGWPGTARTLRGMVHAIKREEFVQNAQLEGIGALGIIFPHIIPQMASLLIVSTTLAVPGFIMSETTLSYLGLGIADPAVSWGSLINSDVLTVTNLRHYPWLLIPVYLLLIVTLGFNFVGDALRDFFDPNHVIFRRFKITNKIKKSKVSKKTLDSVQQKMLEYGSFENKLKSDSIDDKTLLSVEDLKVEFAIRRGKEQTFVKSVRGVSFKMQKGEILGIVGESGSGKTVTTMSIPSLHPYNAQVSGKILFNVQNEFVDLLSCSKSQMRNYRGKYIGMIFQEPGRSFDPLQSMEKVFLETFRNSDPKISKEKSHKKAVDLLLKVGINDAENRLKNYPHQFSGGQLQRIGIALALAQGCKLLIADEPTTALDVTIQAQIVNLLKELNRTENLSIIFISHNIDLVADLCDNMIVMYGGLIMEKGPSEQIMQSPKHPYTRALLASTPRFGLHYSTDRLISIPGRVTDPAHPEPGCPFAPRCRFAKDDCRASEYNCYKMVKERQE